MRRLLYLVVAPILITHSLIAQGVPAEWNVREQLDQLKASFDAIPAEMGRINLERWRNEGAPAAYISQYESILSQVKSLSYAVAELKQRPEKLSTALEIFLRFDSLDTMQRSLMEAVRKYESQQVADAIEARFVASAAPRLQFRTYVLELASLKDREFDVLLAEAQRCRVDKNVPTPPKPPAPPVVKKK